MFELAKYLLLPNMNNYDNHNTAWDTRENSFKKDKIIKTIKDSLPALMYNEVKEN